MTVYEALSLMIAFSLLVVSMLSVIYKILRKK